MTPTHNSKTSRIYPRNYQGLDDYSDPYKLDNTKKWIVRQQTGRWHRRQNKFGKVWQQTKVTTRLMVTYFNWVWQHSRFKTPAAQRAGLIDHRWSWYDILTFPTLI